MRRLVLPLLVVPAFAACAKQDAEPADTAAAVVPASDTAAAPPALRAADMHGTWNGTTMAAANDSVLRRWTSVTSSDSTGKLLFAGTRDSVPFTTRIEGDSAVMSSEAFTSPNRPNGPKVVFRSVGRLRDGKLVGTVETRLASRPDSVVTRARWEATRAP